MKSLCGNFKVKRSRPHRAPKEINLKCFIGQNFVDSIIARGITVQVRKIKGGY